MSRPGAPLRFIGIVLGLWISGRGLWLWAERPVAKSVITFARNTEGHPISEPVKDIEKARFASALKHPPHRQSFGSGPTAKMGSGLRLGDEWIWTNPAPAEKQVDPAVAPPSLVEMPSRWSGSAWLFARSGSGGPALATAGQLGGSQIGTRVRWRINSGPQIRTALTARISAPLGDTKGMEASIGAEWHPLAGQPVWVALERRMALGDHARNAWSAYVAGGIWKPGLPFRLILDGYGQAGVVGAKNRDLFADGALRFSRNIFTNHGPRVGIGLWGAAQPGLARLDIGPHVAVPLRVDNRTLSLSVDARFRFVGSAMPGSGVALTIGHDF